VGGLRAGVGGEPRRPAPAGSQRWLPGEPISAGVHPEGGRATAAAWHCLAGRQDRYRAARGLGKPETFDFLGFTHICGKSKTGRFWLKRVTISKRMRTKLREVNDQLKLRPNSISRVLSGCWDLLARIDAHEHPERKDPPLTQQAANPPPASPRSMGPRWR